MRYPPDHALALARVLHVFNIIAARPEISDEEIIGMLVEEGIEPVDAVLLVCFVPCAMSYSVVKRMGATNLPTHYMVRNQSGRTVLLPLEAEHYFTAALAWAEEILAMPRERRPVSLEAFNAVVHRSAVLNAAERFLESYGPDALQGAVSSPLVVCGITAELIKASRRRSDRERPWWQFWRR
ncbi:MAG: hypothetical protein RMJ88_15710 [Thermogemmata sp.]|nr:hypothetical protein [Thermogemmata sp.]